MPEHEEWGRVSEILASVPAASAMATNVAIMDGIGECQVLQIEVACISDDFTLVIFDSEGSPIGMAHGIHEVFRNAAIDRHTIYDAFFSGGRLWRNVDGVNCFWAHVTNDDAVHATAPIELRISFVGAKLLGE